jgi:hypothetical protein
MYHMEKLQSKDGLEGMCQTIINWREEHTGATAIRIEINGPFYDGFTFKATINYFEEKE